MVALHAAQAEGRAPVGLLDVRHLPLPCIASVCGRMVTEPGEAVNEPSLWSADGHGGITTACGREVCRCALCSGELPRRWWAGVHACTAIGLRCYSDCTLRSRHLLRFTGCARRACCSSRQTQHSRAAGLSRACYRRAPPSGERLLCPCAAYMLRGCCMLCQFVLPRSCNLVAAGFEGRIAQRLRDVHDRAQGIRCQHQLAQLVSLQTAAMDVSAAERFATAAQLDPKLGAQLAADVYGHRDMRAAQANVLATAGFRRSGRARRERGRRRSVEL